METTELLEIIARGEDGKHQFKANFTNVNSLAGELAAFSNSGGGTIFIGVSDDGSFAGLTREDMGRLNQLVSNAASQSVRPPINPQTENVSTSRGLVMVVTVPDGVSKPYMDNSGAIWVKSGADKRKVTSREEIQRIYQTAGLIHGDGIPTSGLTLADLNIDYFKDFFEKNFGESVEAQNLPLPLLLENMNLMKQGVLNISGALLFAKNPSSRLPLFIVKAVSYPGIDIHVEHYLDSQDITGKLGDIFYKSMSFVLRNIRHIQRDQNVNAPGEPEIPRLVLEELIVNALIHRDYFVSAPVRIFIFRDRVEIISPGHLPNNLTIDNIKRGNSNIRNPILASYATKILPYRGLGSGIIRALKVYPDIEFEDDHEGNQFKAVIKRKDLKR
ncbi:RNA-binding domain-containing protein [Desulfobacca acetoxidans]|uniref:Putative transcriptional regulator n=1 Tax=Desulfobacca acetoxidans (strain ATCC 700848 / DSM 11109 / ASRB2) TaxID=880072 RepID=F2NGI9_DESAR|nr:RNA-binding domain-containing protein [Desulfobacca acetoxidans]AEB08602.1 putative transcriptional regulator [Desulfobacca acetoxidans DSM 11109]